MSQWYDFNQRYFWKCYCKSRIWKRKRFGLNLRRQRVTLKFINLKISWNQIMKNFPEFGITMEIWVLVLQPIVWIWTRNWLTFWIVKSTFWTIFPQKISKLWVIWTKSFTVSKWILTNLQGKNGHSVKITEFYSHDIIDKNFVNWTILLLYVVIDIID